MNLSRFRRVAAVSIAAQLALAGWGLSRVPADARVPTHWGPSGAADGYGSPLVAFLLIPVITAGITVLLEIVPRVEPRRENLNRSASAYRTLAIALVLFMAAIQAFVVLAGVGTQLPTGLVFGVGVGVLFAVMGNVLGTVRSNYMFGVRTPWTLASDRSWDLTHRLVGRLFVAGGIVTALAAILLGDIATFVVLMGVVVVVLVVGFWYSYRVWAHDPDRRDTRGGGTSAGSAER